MNKRDRMKLKIIVASALAALATHAYAGQITVFERPEFQGRSMTTGESSIASLERTAFNDVASSVVVADGTWEACTEADFRGRCAELVPGSYGRLVSQLKGVVASLRQVGFQSGPVRLVISPDVATIASSSVSVPAPIVVSSEPRQVVVASPIVATTPVATAQVVTAPVVTAPVVTTTAVVTAAPVVSAVPVPAGPRVVLYQRTGKGVRAIELTASIDDLVSRRFDNSADAAFVSGSLWRLCDGKGGQGPCTDFGPGQYAGLGALDGRITSAYLIAPVQESAAVVATVPAGRAVLYQFPNYGSPSAVVEYGRAPDVNWANFRAPATSLRIESGTWLVCSEMGYQGECRVLDPGDYPVLTGLGNGVASARQVWSPAYGSPVTRPAYGSLDLYRMQ